MLVGRSLVLRRGWLRHGDVLEILHWTIHKVLSILMAITTTTTILPLVPSLASLRLGWMLILMNFLQVRLQLHARNQFNYNLKIKEIKRV